ncbi:unnamed protein product [Cylicocyclus nassatus]|uniref:Transthyretin-like family protein n=1 Tax=Cylicocyclus nassatus TaxID=53992 RepID=A0AA36GTK8_CYLNA|nr:unnamed protein product [Cylicocyclus nassatus]
MIENEMYNVSSDRTCTLPLEFKKLKERKPATGVKIKLYDVEPLKDRKLAQTKTDKDGSFTISGTAKEFSKIDPQLNIYHKCNYKGPCYKKLSIKIPSKYISKGEKVKQYLNIHTMELGLKIKGQKTDCMN